MSKIITNEMFLERLQSVQPNLIPLEKYKGRDVKIHCTCSIHGGDIFKTPGHLYRGQGCIECGKATKPTCVRYTHESFAKKLHSISPTIEILGKYTGIKNRIWVECSICGHKWNPISESLVSKTPCGCPSCANNAPKTTEQFRGELALSHPELVLLSDYINVKTDVTMLCTVYNKTFDITPNKLQQGQHCPRCKISNGERAVEKFLTDYEIKYIPQYKFDDLKGLKNRQLSYDFFLPNYNVLIEFQGEQHDRPVKFHKITDEEMIENFEKQKKHDALKKEYALSKNIKLVEIWYYDINNIESILLNELKINYKKSA